jgi:hypothetical protein
MSDVPAVVDVKLTDTPKRLGQGQLGTSETTLYTVDAGKTAKIWSITVVNTDTSERTFQLALVPSGGSFGAATALFWDLPLAGKATLDHDSPHVLEAGGTVKGLASVASKLTVTIDGAEV